MSFPPATDTQQTTAPCVVVFELRPTWEGCLKRAAFPAATGVRPVRSAADAVAEIATAENRVLVVDSSISMETVIDLLEQSRRLSPVQRVIVIRAAHEMPAEWGLRELGALHVLPETCTPGRLTATVTAALFPQSTFG